MSKTEPFSEANLKAAARAAVRNGMISESEIAECMDLARNDIRLTGRAYICGVTLYLTAKQQDERLAAGIRSMTPAQFERFAYGM